MSSLLNSEIKYFSSCSLLHTGRPMVLDLLPPRATDPQITSGQPTNQNAKSNEEEKILQIIFSQYINTKAGGSNAGVRLLETNIIEKACKHM